eukprot:15936864-Heterocapsa_arctica.AAC.1
MLKLNQLKDKESQEVYNEKSNEKHASELGIDQHEVGGNQGAGHIHGEPNEDTDGHIFPEIGIEQQLLEGIMEL